MVKIKGIWQGLITCILFTSVSPLHAQIEVNFETTPNANCNGVECGYDGPAILINEIMIAPRVGEDGVVWEGENGDGGEWVELYNRDLCAPVDISCFYLGNNAYDFGYYPGGYSFPPGTVVPPAGFVVVRGASAEEVPEEFLIENGGNTIEIVANNPEGEGVCVGDGSRFWFPNYGGWLALYNSFGEPVDAVSWGSQANQTLYPCVAPMEGCFAPSELNNYWEISDDLKSYILELAADSFAGQTIRRIPDGEAWSEPADPTIGQCNAECLDPISGTCTGSATAIASGGSGEYVYQWDDSEAQTTPTAVGLCGQEYCVLVVDGFGNSTTACVTVEEIGFESEAYDTFCEGDQYQLPDSSLTSEPGTFEMLLYSQAGCDSSVTLQLEMIPSYSFELNPQICSNETYILPNGEEVNEAGTYTVNYELDSGCDSTYVVNLNVDPVINVLQEINICAGETYTLPDGNETDSSGQYEIIVPGAVCDTIFAVNLSVHPTFMVQEEDTICEGNTYTLPDGAEVFEGGIYDVMLQSDAGCDSLVMLNLEMFPSYSFELNPEICENESYILPDGEEVNQAGTYTVNYQLNSGCDSTYVVNLSVEPVTSIQQNVSICDGESYLLPDGNAADTSGQYEITLPGAVCDSLFTVNLVVNPTYLVQSDVLICEGESHTFPDGTVVKESGFYVLEMMTTEGCDSIVEALVVVNPVPEINIPLQSMYCFQPGVIPVNATPPGGTLSGPLVNGTNLELDAAPPGNYTVNYSFTNEFGCSNESDHTYSILPEVTPSFSYNADCFNVAHFINETPNPQEDLAFTWAINDTVFSNEESPEYAYDDAGVHVVSLTAINAADCEYSTSMEVLLEEGLQPEEYWLPNIISPNGDELNQYLRLMPGEDDCLEYRITIFNRWGKVVYEMTNSSAPFAGFNNSGERLDEGVYFYQLESPQLDCNSSGNDVLCKGSLHIVR